MKVLLFTGFTLVLCLFGCATKEAVVKTDAVQAQQARAVRSLTPACKPVSEEFARRLRGDDKLASSLDDPAKTRSVDVVAAGFCDSADVRRVIEAREKSLLYCFESVTSSTDGRIVMRWELGSTGKVQHLCLSQDTVGSIEVQNCLNQRISLMRFKPATEGPCMITWPFVFKRGSSFGR